MFKKIALIVMTLAFVSGVALAQGKYSIKTMTPQVQSALDARKERFAELRALKSSGAIGENNKGYVEVLKNESNAQSIANEENHDRQVIYKTIAQQNDLEGSLSTIEMAFAEVQASKAKPGDKIQTAGGDWVAK